MPSIPPQPRILFVCGGTSVYGLERVILRYMSGLSRLGFPLHATANGWTDGVFPRELEKIGVPYDLIKLGWLYVSRPDWTWDTLRNYAGATARFWQIARKFSPDLIVHTGYRSLAALSWQLRRNNVIAVQDYWRRPWEHRLVRMLDRKVRTYLACSEDIARHLRSIGLPNEKVVRIYNPVNFPGEPILRRPTGRTFVYGIIGQVIRRKGHHLAVRALSRLRQLQPDRPTVLRVFGDGDGAYRQEVQHLAVQLGVGDLVQWRGYSNIENEIYGDLDCVLVPSIDPEPFGLVAVEPSRYGLPVVTSDSGGLAEIVIEGETGFRVAAGDTDGWVERMSRLVANPDLGARLGKQAFTANALRFDADIVAKQLANVLAQGLSNPQS